MGWLPPPSTWYVRNLYHKLSHYDIMLESIYELAHDSVIA
jgi:hypothetical protein